MTISGSPYDDCVCKKRAEPHPLCDGVLAFQEKGKKIKLTLRRGEEAVALVLDGCVFRDSEVKCDGLFLWKRGTSKKCAILVELKGAHGIENAFEQIAFVRSQRPEYSLIRKVFASGDGTSAVAEKAVIVSNGTMTRPQWVRFEEQYGFRVLLLLDSDARTPVTDVRDLCR